MIIGAIWVILGIANGYILLKRVTPFNAQDLKIAGDGIALINNYCNGFEVVVIAVGAVSTSDLADIYVETRWAVMQVRYIILQH